MRRAGLRAGLLATLSAGALMSGLASPALAGPAAVATHIVVDTAPGRSLGTKVSQAGSLYTIDGGTAVGPNLFHSFSAFSLGTGDTAAWVWTGGDPATITRVINRVTGGGSSFISGTIDSTALPNADFYFINPAGIVFGQGAGVNVRGATYFSTASELRFADGAKFSAATPSGSTLTMASPSAFGFLGGEGDITADGVGADSAFFAGAGKLSLSAANLQVSDSTIGAGALDLFAVGNEATDLPTEGSSLAGPLGGAITISNAQLSATPDSHGNGELSIVGGEITLVSSAVVTQASDESPGGPLNVRAAELTLDGAASLGTSSSTDEAAGDFAATVSGSVTVKNGSWMGSTTSAGDGAAGNVSVSAMTVVADGGPTGAGNTFIGSQSFSDGNGDAGSVSVEANGSLTLENGGGVTSFGGNGGGSVAIRANSVTLVNGGFITSIGSSADGGNVTVTTGSLTVDGGASLQAVIGSEAGFGFGNGGNVAIRSSGPITIRNGGSVFSNSFADLGTVGSITLSGSDILLDAGATVSSSADNSGSGGEINMSTPGNLTVRDSAISTDGGPGARAGDISITATNIVVDAEDNLDFVGNFLSPGISSDNFAGDAGTVTIVARGSLTVRDGGNINTDGTAGTIRISAGAFDLDGGAAQSFTMISAQGGFGDAGAVSVTVDGDAVIKNGGSINTDAFEGNAGSIALSAANILIDGGGGPLTSVTSTAFDSGSSGSINISTSGSLTIRNGAQVTTDSDGSGRGGNVSVSAANLLIDNVDGGVGGTGISSSATGSGDAGAVSVTVAHGVTVKDGGSISSSYEGFASGSAGKVVVTAGALLLDDGIVEGLGNAGKVIIDVSGGVTVINGAAISATTSDSGSAGDVDVSANSLTIAGGVGDAAGVHAISSDTFGAGAGGDVVVRISGPISISDGASITADTFGAGPAGSVSVTAGSLVLDGAAGGAAFIGSSSTTAREAPSGTPGETLNGTFVGLGNAGDVTVNVEGSLTIENGGFISTSATDARGAAGDVGVTAASLALRSGGLIETNSANANAAGDIVVSAPQIGVGGVGSAISSANTGSGGGPAGSIIIHTGPLVLSDGGAISTNSSNGPAGQISIALGAEGHVLLHGAGAPGAITTTSGTDSGGKISVEGGSAIVLNGSLIQALGPGNAADVTLNSGAIIESADRVNQIAVAGVLQLDSQIVDVASSVTNVNLGFLDASQVLKGQCAARQASGGTSQLGTKAAGPYASPPPAQDEAPKKRPGPSAAAARAVLGCSG